MNWMKNAKRMASLALAGAMMFSLAACTETQVVEPEVTPTEPVTATVATTTSVVEASSLVLSELTAPGNPDTIPADLDIDWNTRYTFAELEAQLEAMADYDTSLTNLYSYGTSWQERDLWCLEITNEDIPADEKIGIGVFANIHGGERESAASAMYTAWWTLLNSDSEYVSTMLDQYIIYVVPVINPDGYEQSFVNNNRQNLRPTDRNGDNIPFSDPYTDIDGDGYIANIYVGTADQEMVYSYGMTLFGMESSDWDNNGVLGDDPRSSTIDMNRSFDYQWNRYDIETKGDSVIGVNAWSSAGPDAASEPEIAALQNFLAEKPMNALVSIHTGIQCVLYPWCYREYDETNPDDADIPFMKATAEAMASTYTDTTGRGFYCMSSWEDYPTSAEMIDYAYGTFNIHAYTIEVYNGGQSATGDIADCKWENELPTPTWVFYSQADIQEKLGLDPSTLVGMDGSTLAADEGLWFYTSSVAQMVDKAPTDQDIMVEGAKDSILVMIESEPYGDGYERPFYVK